MDIYQKRKMRQEKAKNENKEENSKYNINWFPGHMKKTMEQIQKDLKLVDIVVELLDARIPMASQNPEIKKLIKNKKRIVVLNKADLADEKENQKWVSKFAKENIPAILCNSSTGEGVSKIIPTANEIMKKDLEKAENKGRVGKIIRIMIIGVPNVGKSSIINKLAQKNSAVVGNKPGVTKQKQWIRLSNNVELLDTPGVLWPKLDNEKVALDLAYTGTIKSEVLEQQEIAYNLMKILLEEYKQNVIDRYLLNSDIVEKILNNQELEENERIAEVMEYIGEKRGAKLRGNQVDLEKTSKIILDDYRSGNLGKITLEKAEKF